MSNNKKLIFLLGLKSMDLADFYKDHHSKDKKYGFSIYEERRGKLIASIIESGKKVLDIGARDGTLTRYYVEGNDVLAIDIDDKALKKCAKLGVRVKKMDINKGIQIEETFDVIVLGEVLEHLIFPGKILSQITQLLSKNGLFLGSVPNLTYVRDRIGFLFGKYPLAMRDKTHLHHFTYSRLKNILQTYFENVKIVAFAQRFQPLANIMPSLFADTFFWLARKSCSESFFQEVEKVQ